MDDLVARIREHGTAGQAIRPVGGGTKLGWGGHAPGDVVDLETGSLDRIAEHNVGDFTAVLQAGVRVAEAQARFAAEGQMLALDPPLGASASADEVGRGDEGAARGRATIGGMVATADSGPLRHRYGGVRDLIVGITVVLSDGTVAKAGGKVIKNVAGYDLAKLFTGSYGTLGLIADISVRLHPLPSSNATAVGTSDDPERLASVARELATHPLEADALDVAWDGDAGRVLVRFGSAAAAHQAEETLERMQADGLSDVQAIEDDAELWERQRAAQRSPDGIVLKVSGRPADLVAVIDQARGKGGTVVSRAALGLSWLALPADADVVAVRDALHPRPVAVLDGADRVEQAWPSPPEGTLAVMARVKERFDPARIFRPGAFVGGI
jgi:glycolate oxidase FAD binding subunit